MQHKRMRRVLLFVIYFIAVFLSAHASIAFAASNPIYYDWSATTERTNAKVLGATTSPTSSSANFFQFTSYLLGGDFTPANPLYFIKPLQENVVLAFTFDPVKKEKVRLAIAGERIDEMEKIAGATSQANGVSVAASGYEDVMTQAANELEALRKQKADISSLTKQFEEETAKQNIVLEQVSVQVPDTAQVSVDDAIKANWDGTDTVADLAGRPAVPPDLVDRLQSFKAQGLLTAEEVTKLISLKTRSEARLEMQKYVKEGVIPESDFLRMNENVKALYPQDFYKQHEVKRFQELQQLESQKPDQATLTKIADFSKTYTPGDVVPFEIRRYWVPVLRLEELQNTLRPDLIDPNLLRNNQGDVNKFHELVERFKPRPEDMAYMQTYMKQNNADVTSLPPEYQRMYNLARTYGAQCGSGQNWVPDQASPSGGYCAASGTNTGSIGDFAKGKTCSGIIVSAKGTGGACSAFSSDCVPPGWTQVATCVQTPSGSQTAEANQQKTIACPSNAHFVPVLYLPDGGYCIPNYTTTNYVSSSGQTETACQGNYHRNYPGGPCFPNAETGNFQFDYRYLPPITLTPGGPNYPTAGRCGSGNHWAPEPINPSGGYCAPDSYTYQSGGGGQQVMPGNGLPKTDMGNCRTPDECYDFCKANPTTASCSGFSPSQPRPDDTSTPSRESQEAACRAGGGTCVSWVNGTCGCERYTGSGTTNTNSGSSSASQEAACRSGGGTCTSWNNGACSCTHSGSTTTSPPSGYGSCGSGMTWNGSSCVSQASPTNSTQSMDPATACAQGGCTWTGSSCNCPSQPQTQSQPAPTSAPQPQTMDPASECANHGGTWADNTCTGAH